MSPCALISANLRRLAGEEFAKGQNEAVLRHTARVRSTPSANHPERPAETVAELPRTEAARPR